MPTIAAINALDREAFVAVLGRLFEHRPGLRRRHLRSVRFMTRGSLLAELGATVRRAPVERQLALIRAHPDLAGRLAQAGGLTAESAREQAGAGLDRLSAGELADFGRRNSAYRERFGFPFVICARLNDRKAILQAMEMRLRNSPDEERGAALAEIDKIAWLRLQDLLMAPTGAPRH